MNGRIDSGLGQIVIDTDVIATYAGSVAVECFGIIGMAAISVILLLRLLCPGLQMCFLILYLWCCLNLVSPELPLLPSFPPCFLRSL